ncbi:MAG TPA: sodium:alanine symporter family protein [Chlamydiales bacterium]|nr:sodium:alanine symporter family protein [Chlamydiales bacterium]
METLLQRMENWVWGAPLLILLLIVGLYLTFILRGVQFRYLFYSIKLAFTRQDDGAQGDISHFQALMTALAATIGIGSIAGVATAVFAGGLGAIFWMWISALLGMATKFGEAILAIKYRIKDEKGEMCGGPMYYLERGLQMKWLAIFFAIFGALAAIGTGNMVQANSVSLALGELLQIDPWVSGIVLAAVTGVTLFGGIKSIGKVSSVLVPVMAVFYIVGGLIILLLRINEIPAALSLIIKSAFTGQAAFGGFLGSTMMMGIQFGISRGVFSSEAGLGSAPIAAAAAKTDVPGRQALVSMSGVFITSFIVCSITGLAIAVTNVLGGSGPDGVPYNGSVLALKAFDSILPGGGVVVTISLILFAYSTIIGWAYYGEKCMEYLCGVKIVPWYRLLFTAALIPGAIMGLQTVWSFANIMNGLMAFPNLIGLFGLSSVIQAETRSFISLLKKERRKERIVG